MANYDAVDLLARLRLLIRRPTADETLTDPQAYQLLTDAELAVYEDITARAPFALMNAPTLMTSSDAGKTYTFGTDSNGNPIAPMGHAQVYPTINSVPDYPLVEGVDYLNEGDLIRIPNNRSLAVAPYWQGVSTPQGISASLAPSLQPAHARTLIVSRAAQMYAELGDLRESGTYARQYVEGLARHLLRLKTAFMTQGGYAARRGGNAVTWWRAPMN